jgi:hypothetical protein
MVFFAAFASFARRFLIPPTIQTNLFDNLLRRALWRETFLRWRCLSYQYEKMHITACSRVIHDGISRLFQTFTDGSDSEE